MAKAKKAKKASTVATEEVASTKQVLEHGKAVLVAVGETRTVETTTAVFEDVGERGAHRAVFIEGEPRAADEVN